MEYSKQLRKVASDMVAYPKGILAADASERTMNKRLDAIDVDENEENRRRYRDLLFATEGIEAFLSGVILYDGTIHQKSDDSVPFVKVLADRGMIPGIKVDLGTDEVAEFPGEKITKGLDTLNDRLKEYVELGAMFCKWRSVITIDTEKNLPTQGNIERNAKDLAQYAKICQDNGLVPMVEPEVLMAGKHSIEDCRDATTRILNSLFHELSELSVDLGGVILKSNMVIGGSESESGTAVEVADATLGVFGETVPHDLGGIVFLSGGQSPEQATENLNEMSKRGEQPWSITFSYSRALQAPVLEKWHGKDENREAAQKIFYRRCELASLARKGEYMGE